MSSPTHAGAWEAAREACIMMLLSAHNTLFWYLCVLLQARCSANQSALP